MKEQREQRDLIPDRLKSLLGTEKSGVKYISEQDYLELMETRRRGVEAVEKHMPKIMERKRRLQEKGIL